MQDGIGVVVECLQLSWVIGIESWKDKKLLGASLKFEDWLPGVMVGTHAHIILASLFGVCFSETKTSKSEENQ